MRDPSILWSPNIPIGPDGKGVRLILGRSLGSTPRMGTKPMSPNWPGTRLLIWTERVQVLSSAPSTGSSKAEHLVYTQEGAGSTPAPWTMVE